MKPILLLLLCLLLLSCNERNPDNPFDPQVDISRWTPTNLQIFTLTPSSVKLSWTDNSSGLPSGSTATFNIERKTGNGSFTLAGNTNVAEYTDTNLLLDISYQWRIKACFEQKISDYSEVLAWQFTPDVWAPTNLIVTEISHTSVKLNWQDNSGFETGFQIERKTASGSFNVISTVNANTLQYTDINLTPHTQYTYRVRAFAAENYSSYSSEVNWTSSKMPVNFIQVVGGTFNNGTSDVTISNFYLDKYELMQSAYQVVMGSNPSSGYGVGANYPVYYVSWFNAIEYCNSRSINEGLTPCYSYSTYGTNPATWPAGWNTTHTNHANVACSWTANGYRLPTEAEWEFAARGGNSTHNYTYSGSNAIDGVAWYSSNSGSSTHTVGTKTANELGLFDMSGNVWEWNWDIYGTYASGAQTNPHGVVSGSYRVLRGGSWDLGANYGPVSYRYCGNATLSYHHLGFRCVRISP